MNKAVPSAQANSTKSSQIVIDKPPRILVISSVRLHRTVRVYHRPSLGSIARIATLVDVSALWGRPAWFTFLRKKSASPGGTEKLKQNSSREV